MQRTISFLFYNKEKSKRGRGVAHIFVFRRVSRKRVGAESQGGRSAGRNAAPEKYKNMSNTTTAF
jgi:hypothetical protein